MKPLQHSVKAFVIIGEDSEYIADCLGLPIITQVKTLDNVVKNLKEAVTLHFEGENPTEMGYIENPSIIIIL